LSAARKASGPAGLRVVVNAEGERLLVSAARLRSASSAALQHARVRDALVSITLLSPRRMAAMNKKHLGHAGATDVITFGFRDPRGAVLGDIYLCPSVAAANAKRFGVSAKEELLRLAIHGTLHVLGHEHPEGATRTKSTMWKLQERLLAKVKAS
jgi:probable rRNA maturation factor